MKDFHLDENILLAAAARWESQDSERTQKIKSVDKGHIERAESGERIAKRIDYILAKTRSKSSKSISIEAHRATEALTREAASGDPGPDLLERVIGETRDFLSITFLSDGISASRSVARITTRLADGRVAFGTGFMVSPDLMMTNHHVLKSPEEAAASFAEFDFQIGNDGSPMTPRRFNLAPQRLFFNDADHDMAIVAIEPRSQDGVALTSYGHCPLIAEEGKILVGDPINIVQHPEGERKQIVIRENRLLDLPAADGGRFAHYEADTEQGSSGSPVFNDQWDVIALHHSGVPKRDSKGNILNVDGGRWKKGEEIEWIGNEGIRVSRLVARLRDARPTGSEPALLERMLELGAAGAGRERTEPTTSPIRQPSDSGGTDFGVAADSSSPASHSSTRPSHTTRFHVADDNGAQSVMRITVPLNISISLGQARHVDTVEATDDEVSGAEERKTRSGKGASRRPAPDYNRRPGYDSGFLGVEIPMPKPAAAGGGNGRRAAGDSQELKYFHYSVIMNARRRLAFVSAVNVNASAPVQFERKGKDEWFLDPRIDEEDQADNEFYADNPLDRGHLTRRADAAWGSDEDEARKANIDTFHWTNCSPQHEIFNQSSRADQRGLLLWGNLENHVMAQAERDLRQVSVFNGPIFRNSDRSHRGLQIPREYWKVIAYRTNNGIGAVGFILSQESLIRNLPEEDFVVGPYEPFQVSIASLATRTKLDFRILAEKDALARPDVNESFRRGEPAILPITALEKIIL